MRKVDRTPKRLKALASTRPNVRAERLKAEKAWKLIIASTAASAPVGKTSPKGKAAKAAKAAKVKPFKFKVYKSPEVRSELERIFHRKCAYCETRYEVVQPMDVEHFRPKGDVQIETPLRRLRGYGYYWLASDWHNLLPSCIDCNRMRKHFIGSATKDRGKGNQFPLVDESKRAKKSNEVGTEEPILLNPCIDDPRHFLSFLEDGNVRPASVDPAKVERAEKSIEVYGLDRPELVRARRERIRFARGLFEILSDLVLVFDSLSSGLQRQRIESRINVILEELLSMCAATQSYSEAVAQSIARWSTAFNPFV